MNNWSVVFDGLDITFDNQNNPDQSIHFLLLYLLILSIVNYLSNEIIHWCWRQFWNFFNLKLDSAWQSYYNKKLIWRYPKYSNNWNIDISKFLIIYFFVQSSKKGSESSGEYITIYIQRRNIKVGCEISYPTWTVIKMCFQ